MASSEAGGGVAAPSSQGWRSRNRARRIQGHGPVDHTQRLDVEASQGLQGGGPRGEREQHKGKILRDAIGAYSYIKREFGNGAAIEVQVFLLKVSKYCKRWPEKRKQQRAWFDLEAAARANGAFHAHQHAASRE